MKLADRACLLAALGALGYGPDQIEEGEALHLYGYHGDEREETAEIVVRRRHLGRWSNDLGFRKTPHGYVPTISQFDQGHLADKHACRNFAAHLRTEYSKQVVQTVARKLRGSVQQSKDGGKLTLRVRY